MQENHTPAPLGCKLELTLAMAVHGIGMKHAVHELLRRGRFAVARRLRRPIPGGFQPYGYTFPNRYPWLVDFARSALRGVPEPRLLSFGCSSGDEIATLRRAFPRATIRGLDIDARAISTCVGRFRSDERISCAVAADASGEPDGAYDAVFCLAVLCHGDLTVTRARRSDRLFPFVRFERAVADLARCVRPGMWLYIHCTNYRFCDTWTALQFETVLEAAEEDMPADLLYDRDNRLIVGQHYRPIGFRRRTG